MRRNFRLIVSGSDYVKAHPLLEADLRSLLERSGLEADFQPKLSQRLKWLENRKRNCILRKDWFEQLKGSGGLYAIRFNKLQKNVRILFTFVVDESNREYAVLLHAFEEKNGRKRGPYTYTQAIEVAKSRLKEVSHCES